MNIKNNKVAYFSLLLATTLFVGCGGSSSSGPSKNSGTGNIDLANYFPNKDMSKTFSTVEGNTTDLNSGSYEENIAVTTENNITTITTIDDGDIEKILISDKNITQISDDINFSTYRHVNLGDTFFKIEKESTQDINKSGFHYAKVTSKVKLECTIEEQLKNFTKGEHKYSGDLLKIKCINNGEVIIDIAPNLIALAPESFKDINGSHTNYDISYAYMKKDIGGIAIIDDDCIVNSTEPKSQDDRKTECIEKHYDYEYYLGN